MNALLSTKWVHCQLPWVSRSDLSEEQLATEHVRYNTECLENLWSEVDDLHDHIDDFFESIHLSASSTDPKLASLQEQVESLQLDAKTRLGC